MAEENFALTTMYAGWKEYQDRIRNAVASLTAEQFKLRAAPDMRSIGELTRHIVGTRVGWFTFVLKEEVDEDVKSYQDWGDLEKNPGASEFVVALDKTWQMMSDRLGRWNDEDMKQTFQDDWDGKIVYLSRAWIIYHLMEHDIHHGGELSLTLGIHGIPADFPG